MTNDQTNACDQDQPPTTRTRRPRHRARAVAARLPRTLRLLHNVQQLLEGCGWWPS